MCFHKLLHPLQGHQFRKKCVHSAPTESKFLEHSVLCFKVRSFQLVLTYQSCHFDFYGETKKLSMKYVLGKRVKKLLTMIAGDRV